MEGQEVREENRRGRDRPNRQGKAGGLSKGKKKCRVPLPAIIGAVILTAAVTTVLISLKNRETTQKPEGLVYEANIIEGDIPGKTKEERQRELNSIVEEGMLSMSMNATPSGKTTGANREINWLIENPSNQGKLIRVEIWRDDTNEKIYETGAIPPGNYVESAPLMTELPPGEYTCTARFYAYQEDETYLGQAAAQIQLVLME